MLRPSSNCCATPSTRFWLRCFRYLLLAGTHVIPMRGAGLQAEREMQDVVANLALEKSLAHV